MRRNRRLYKPLVLLLIALMLCSTVVAQTDMRPARADSGNLADKAVAFLKAEYQNSGAQGGYGGIGPFDAYVLKSAGVDVSEWEYNDESLPDAVTDLVDQDIDDDTASVKHLAQDLITMQELGDSGRADQLKALLQNRQNDDGSFQDDPSVYSIIPAYELLGRAGQLSIVDAVHAQDYILGQQDSSTGAWPDFMGTAQAVRALNYLAPGAAPDSAVGQAIASGCNWLKQQQKPDGSFQAALDDPLIDTAEAVTTQKALGLDPAADWTTGGKSAVDYLNDSSLNDDGSFGSSRNVMDATWALDSFVLLGILPTGDGGGGGGPSTDVSVRVRVEGITSAPADTTVSVSGTALDALNQAVGSGNVVAPGGFINSINGEAGSPAANPPTSWFYYAIRNGYIDPVSLGSVPSGYTVSDGDQVVFFIGAYDAVSCLTCFPVVSVSPQAPTAGQDITFSISALKYDWSAGLQELSEAEAAAIGDYTLTAGGETYTSSNGQVTVPDVAEGDLSYAITNQNTAGYPDVVPYRGSVSVGAAENVSVRVRVEGITGAPVDTTVSVSGSALDALNQAVGSGNVVAPGGFINSINGEAGNPAANPPTSWFYYAIRNGYIDPVSLSSVPSGYTVSDGDQVVFYIGAYDAVSCLTCFPVVSVSPQAPTAGQDITFSISALKYDWSAGLQELSEAEVAAIGDYTLTAGGETYTSSNGQVTVPDAAEGDLGYAITNQNTAGYPDVVPYRGSISVGAANSSGSTTTCTPGVAVVGMSGEILFGPSTVTVLSTNPWGLTAMGALDATGLSYTTSSTWDGYVDSIDGQASSGTKGWMYTVNGATPMVLAKDYTISSGDKVIWYYSNSMDQEAPTWTQLSSSVSSTPQAVTSTTGNATVYPTAGGTVGLGSEASIFIPADALSGTAGVEVAIQKVSSPPAAPDGFRLLGSVFEFTVGGSTSYKFKKPLTLSFSFDVSALTEGEMPSVYYYDAASSKWVDLGGTVDGSIITVSIDHFTRFALLIKDVKPPLTTAQSFTDVPASFWASEAIINLNRLGYINGYPDGTFKPDNQITRSEFVSILDKVLKLPSHSPSAPDFNDISSKDWFYGAVENAVHAGIIKGYGSTFNPNRRVTREELAVIMVNALGKYDEVGASMSEKTGFSDDADISDWARGFVVVAVKNGLIKGYPNGGFDPQGSATRAEACVIITNFLNLKES